MVKRAAFTMIELIFAIVVISIAVISLPMMTQINAKGISENIKQEAIFIASAKLIQTLSFAWDKRSVDANNTFDSARVVDLLAGGVYGRRDIANVDDNNSIFRIGHIRESLHRRFFNFNDNNVTHNAPVNGIGIEDQATTSANITGDSTVGYKNLYRTRVSVSYVNDSSNTLSITPLASATESNLKLVEVIVEDSNTVPIQTVVKLRSYVANIGEVDYFSRIY